MKVLLPKPSVLRIGKAQQEVIDAASLRSQDNSLPGPRWKKLQAASQSKI